MSHPGAGALVVRVAVGAALGGVIGYERDRHGRQAGLRTHLLVAMAAATFMAISAHFVYLQGYGEGDHVDVDGSRIAASVVSGIGFLAGGSILRSGANVQGLTTAAGLWLVTAIGMGAGAGMFALSAAVTAMGMLALTFARRFEDKNDNVLRRRIFVVFGDGGSVARLVEAAAALGVTLQSLEYERRLDEKRRLAVSFDVQLPAEVGVDRLLEALERLPAVLRVRVLHV